MIFFFFTLLFLIIIIIIIIYYLFIYLFFFCSLILDVPCLYRQPTAKKTTLPLFHPFLPFLSVSRDPNLSLSFSHLSFSRFLSLSFSIHSVILNISPRYIIIISSCVYKEYYIISFSCRYNIIIGNNIPSVLMQYRYYY